MNEQIFTTEEEVTQVNPVEYVHTVTDGTPIDFGSNNDSKFYTLQGYEAHSVAEQECAYILDTRNIVFILLFSLVLLRLYGQLKNTISNYFS